MATEKMWTILPTLGLMERNLSRRRYLRFAANFTNDMRFGGDGYMSTALKAMTLSIMRSTYATAKRPTSWPPEWPSEVYLGAIITSGGGMSSHFREIPMRLLQRSLRDWR